jgi:hypothetical protein
MGREAFSPSTWSPAYRLPGQAGQADSVKRGEHGDYSFLIYYL